MIKINKVNNSLTVEGVDNVFYPNNGDNSYPLNSLIVVTDNSDMATFRSVATNDVLFSGLIKDITINGEAVTKDNIIEKFDAVSNSSTGGISDEQAQEIAKIPTLETELAQKANVSDVPTVQTDNIGTNKNYIYSNFASHNHQYNVISALANGSESADKYSLLLRTWGPVSAYDNFDINAATTTAAGVMTAADKTKLDSIPETIPSQSEIDGIAANVSALQTTMDSKQATLVSGENIKTINSESILGSGDIQISAGAKLVKIGDAPFSIFYNLLNKAVSALNNGTDYTDSFIQTHKTICKQYFDLFKTLKNGDLLSYYDEVFGDIFKVECNPFYFEYSGGGNSFDIPIKYLGNFSSNNYINYTRDIYVHFYFYKYSSGEIGQVELKVYTKKAGPTLQKNDFKTINGESLIGEGNLEVSGVSEEQAQEIAKIPTLETDMMGKQPTLVSGTNIKTINGESVLGEGNLEISGGDVDLTNYYTKTETDTKLDTKQNTLVSGTNIKTINSQSILGEGNIEVTIPDATTATSGAMSAADKTKLDSISNEWTGTQAEYDALTTKDDNIMYYITE